MAKKDKNQKKTNMSDVKPGDHIQVSDKQKLRPVFKEVKKVETTNQGNTTKVTTENGKTYIGGTTDPVTVLPKETQKEPVSKDLPVKEKKEES